jgi:hypothetical protein
MRHANGFLLPVVMVLIAILECGIGRCPTRKNPFLPIPLDSCPAFLQVEQSEPFFIIVLYYFHKDKEQFFHSSLISVEILYLRRSSKIVRKY